VGLLSGQQDAAAVSVEYAGLPERGEGMRPLIVATYDHASMVAQRLADRITPAQIGAGDRGVEQLAVHFSDPHDRGVRHGR
jgi:hypothetical protein